MRTLKLLVAYDGSAYHGFQLQKDIVTVQGVLEAALAKLCGEPVRVAASGRTDTGVHALGQVISFATSGRIACADLVRAANGMLPKDMVVISAEEADAGFHARFSARWKTYEYRLVINARHDPFLERYAWQLRTQPEVEAMNRAAAELVGAHDFTGFQSSGSENGSPIKTIYEAFFRSEAEALVFRISGNGFLYHMVRNIVWLLVQVGLNACTLDDFKAKLDQEAVGPLNRPAPPQGLYLLKVGYADFPEAG